MKTQLFAAGLAMILGGGYVAGALAQVKPETHVRQRQAVMTLQGKYFFPLVPMAQGKIPFDSKIVARNAAFLDPLSEMPWDNFVEATSGEKSRALPEIYKNASGFRTAQDRLMSSVDKLVAVSKGGDEASTKAAIGEVLKACNACHDNFRAKQ